MNGGINARQLRILLMIVMLLIVGGAIGGFVFIQKNISNYATAISSLNANAESGDLNLTTLNKLEERLKNGDDEIAAARALVADEATYGDKVVDDITKIAKESNVVITGFEFVDATTSAAQPAPAPVAAAPGAAAPPSSAVPTGITKKAVSVSIITPLKYANLMTFLSKIETNELQLQVASLSMTKDGGDLVATQTFVIELYVRSKAKA